MRSIQFDRQAVAKWEKLNDVFSIDWSSKIGSGSYGSVFKGYSKQKDCLIAIKVVKNNLICKRQIDTLKSLSSLIHPNIMGFYGEIIKGENAHLFLEYCNSGTLAEWIQKGIPEIQVLKLFRQMVQGMCYMNAKLKMHRDFKPDNILIGPQNDIKICDFGLSQGTNSIFVTNERGTPFYAAPEVYLIKANESYSYNCDVWSAGLILYQMLTKKKLFEGVKDYYQLKQQWLSYERGLKYAQIGKQFHPLWSYFLNWMIQFDPSKRPTFHEVLENLKRVYDRMKDNINKKVNMIEALHLKKADTYITFQISKHQILLNLCQKFTKEDIRICNEFKYVSMFMCLLRYTLFIKQFIRALRYKRIKHEGQDLIPPSQDCQAEIQMFCDKNRFILEHRLAFYSKQLKQTVIPVIQNKYQKRSQSITIMKELTEVTKIVEKYSKGEVIQDNQELCEIFKNILIPLRKRHKDYKKFNERQPYLYAYLLASMLIEQKFPEIQYLKLDVQAEMTKLSHKSKEELQRQIESMHDQICN